MGHRIPKDEKYFKMGNKDNTSAMRIGVTIEQTITGGTKQNILTFDFR